VKKGVWMFQSCMPSCFQTAHTMLKDVGAMEQIFTASSLASVLSEQV